MVLQSTTVPETTLQVLVPIFERATGGRVGVDFYLGYAPDRVDPANRSGWTLRTTPKIVSGVTEECRCRTRLLYETVVDTVVEASSPTVAEMVKLYENTFRQVNIALANELALVCGRLGISAWEVIDAAATKPFGFMAHYPRPGPGWRLHSGRAALHQPPAEGVRLPDAHDRGRPRDQHGHARARRRPRRGGAQRPRPGRPGRAHHAAGNRLQAERVRPAGVAGDAHLRRARRPRRRRSLLRSPRRLGGGRRTHLPLGGVVGRGGRRRRLHRDPDASRRVLDRPLWREANAVVVDTRNVAGAVDAGVVSI